MDLFEFEAAEDAPVEASAPSPVAAPAAEPAPAAAEPGPDEGEGEEFDPQRYIDDELEARLAGLRYQQPPPVPGYDQYGQQAQPEALPEYDPFDPEAAARYFDARDERLLQRFQDVFAPVTSALEQAQWADQQQRWEQAKKDLVADAISQGGSELTDNGQMLAESLVDSYRLETEQHYGPSNRANELASAHAVEFVRELEAQAEQRGVEKYKNQLQTLSGAPPAEPGAAGAAVVPGRSARPLSTDEIIRKYAG